MNFVFVEENKIVFNKCPNYPWYQCFNLGLERPIVLEADKPYHIQLLTVTDGEIETEDTKLSKIMIKDERKGKENGLQ